ncbi:MAG: SHOCT domain-containing protein [Thiohalocapsa sp.]|nr:SHOCT domain-containing protein [Thiohalocapsa sp.]MCF7989984.1 SHOCT domain-containing protein [Thiohalocapsa sp.]
MEHPNCRILIKIAAVLLLGLTSGCATITRGTNDTLVVETDPPGAEVKLSNGMVGETPATFKLPRKESVIVKLRKADYEPVEVNVRPQISGGGGAGMAGNLLFGGVVGAAVDAGSGAMNDLRPNPVSVRLRRLDGRHGAGDMDAAEARLERLKAMRRKGVISESEYRQGRAEVLGGI